MADIRVSTWNELNDQLYANSWQEGLSRFRLTQALRGMANAEYDLRTSLARLGNSVEIEEHMLRNFRKYAHREMLPNSSVWDWLALAQHHGLSTRLLDWSYSPLVAMHFATEKTERFDLDGVIWAVDYRRTNELLPPRLQQVLRDEGSDVFTADMLARAVRSLREFDSLSQQPFVAFFEPPSLDERIVNQYALFSLISNPGLLLDRWLEEHPDVYRRIVLPAELKWEVRDKLDQANVTERVLYPGLDGLSRWLNRYYLPRGVDRLKPGMAASPDAGG